MNTVHLSVSTIFLILFRLSSRKETEMIRTLFTLVVITTFISGCAMIGIWKHTHKSKALVEDAVEVLERDGSSAFDEFNEPPWRDGEHYLFVFRHDGVMLFHPVSPDLVGLNRWETQDVNGVFIIQNMINIVRTNGHGWTEYHWKNPVSGKIEPKRSYVSTATMDGTDIVVGSGYYTKE